MAAGQLRYGIVGLGRSGWGIHVKGLRPRSDAKIVAVVDPLDQRREEAKTEFGCRTYSRLDDMLDQDDIDVVIVATPSVDHARDTIKSLHAGKHVAVEKPMALHLADADEMIRTAKEAGRQLFVHHNLRFRPEYQHLKQTIDSGIIGEVFHMRVFIAGFFFRYDWQTLSKYGGGVLNNTCTHYIDMLLQFLAPAKVTELFSDMKQIISAGDVEDHVKVLMRADSGCTIDLEISTAEKVETDLPKWIICGRCGTLTSISRLPGDTSTASNYDPKQVASIVNYFDPAHVPSKQALDGPVLSRRYELEQLPWQQKIVKVEDARSVGDFYDSIAATLLHGESMYVTCESVRETMRVIEEIRKGTEFAVNELTHSAC